MNKFTNPLENIKIASPCSADWNEMAGDNRKRFCGECKLNVYNLSGMTKPEAEQLISNSDGRLCVRFYKRADGTILTEDCPVGFAAFKKRVSKTVAAFASLIFGVIGGLGMPSFFNQKQDRHTMGEVAYQPTPKRTPKQKPTPTPAPEDLLIMGGIEKFEPTPTPKKATMGKIAVPKAQTNVENFEMGDIAIPSRN